MDKHLLKVKIYMLLVLMMGVSVMGTDEISIEEREHNELLDKAFDERDEERNTLIACAYTLETVIEGVGTIKERFDPSRGQGLQWQILQVNGEEPTDRQRDRYEPAPRQRHPAVLSFDFIERDSVKLLDHIDSTMLFSYEVIPHKSTELQQQVSHQLKIDANRGQLIELRSVALEPFRIQPWMKIQEYESASTFRFEEQVGGIVLEQVWFKIQAQSGRESQQKEVTKKFSDFDCPES